MLDETLPKTIKKRKFFYKHGAACTKTIKVPMVAALIRQLGIDKKFQQTRGEVKPKKGAPFNPLAYDLGCSNGFVCMAGAILVGGGGLGRN